MIETHTFETTGGASITIEPHMFQGQRFEDGNRNVQVTCKDLGGGSFSVAYRVPRGSQFVEHISGALETDAIMLSGKEAPIFDAVRVSFDGVPAAPNTQTITLNTWPL